MAKKGSAAVPKGAIDQHKRMAMGQKVTGQALKKGGTVKSTEPSSGVAGRRGGGRCG